MASVTRPFDPAEYLGGAADQADLLNDAVDSGDPRYIAYALGAVARARGGIGKLAREAGMNGEADDGAGRKEGLVRTKGTKGTKAPGRR